MTQAAILDQLRAHQAELRAIGVEHLLLHGSFARGDTHPGSDIDLIAQVDASRRFSLLTWIHLQNQLADMLGRAVDLAPASALREEVRHRAADEAVLAF